MQGKCTQALLDKSQEEAHYDRWMKDWEKKRENDRKIKGDAGKRERESSIGGEGRDDVGMFCASELTVDCPYR